MAPGQTLLLRLFTSYQPNRSRHVLYTYTFPCCFSAIICRITFALGLYCDYDCGVCLNKDKTSKVLSRLHCRNFGIHIQAARTVIFVTLEAFRQPASSTFSNGTPLSPTHEDAAPSQQKVRHQELEFRVRG